MSDALLSDIQHTSETAPPQRGRGGWDEGSLTELRRILLTPKGTYKAAGRHFGVSDAAIHVVAKRHGLGYIRRCPSRGGVRSVNVWEAGAIIWQRGYVLQDILDVMGGGPAYAHVMLSEASAHHGESCTISDRREILRKRGGPRSMSATRKARLTAIFKTTEGPARVRAVEREFEVNP